MKISRKKQTMWRLPTALSLLLTIGHSHALADSGAASSSEGGIVSTLLGYLNDGGAVMYAILAISLLGTVLFMERGFDLYVLMRLNADGFMARILRAVEGQQYAEAIQLCNARSQHPLIAAIKAGLLRANQREKDIERAMEREMLSSLPRLGRRIGLLGLLANSATLAGLLGTIFGLIAAFNSVAMASAAERQSALAGGISQAMYTTAFGIAVALPLLFFHQFLSKRQEQIMMEIEAAASSLLVAMAGNPSQGHNVSPLPPRDQNDGLRMHVS